MLSNKCTIKASQPIQNYLLSTTLPKKKLKNTKYSENKHYPSITKPNPVTYETRDLQMQTLTPRLPHTNSKYTRTSMPTINKMKKSFVASKNRKRKERIPVSTETLSTAEVFRVEITGRSIHINLHVLKNQQ